MLEAPGFPLKEAHGMDSADRLCLGLEAWTQRRLEGVSPDHLPTPEHVRLRFPPWANRSLDFGGEQTKGLSESGTEWGVEDPT